MRGKIIVMNKPKPFIPLRTLLFLLFLCTVTNSAAALDREEQTALRNELRIGWGDMMYETSVYHTNPLTDNYRYTGHLFAEYQRTLTYWCAVGFQLDYEQVWWNKRPSISSEYTAKEYFYNLSLLPTLRFTYFFHPYVNLYSSLNIGLLVNAGTEQDMKGRHTACAPAFGITALGVKVGNKHIFATIEIGGLSALTGKNYIYMVGSRIFTASIGCNF